MAPKERSKFLHLLPILLAVVILLAAAALLLWMFLGPGGAGPSLDLPVQSGEGAPADTPAPETPAGVPSADAPAAMDVFRCGELTMDLPQAGLLLDQNETRTRAAVRDGDDAVPRLDAQRLQAQKLEAADYEALAAGLLQAYYADPPATEAVTVEADPALELAYLVRTDAVGETPAMAARVRFLPLGERFWYLILVYPAADGPGDALTTAFESARLE